LTYSTRRYINWCTQCVSGITIFRYAQRSTALTARSRSQILTSDYCQNFLLFQNDCNQRRSCLVTIQNERENKWLVYVIKNSGILHLFVAVNQCKENIPVTWNNTISNTLDNKANPPSRWNSPKHKIWTKCLQFMIQPMFLCTQL